MCALTFSPPATTFTRSEVGQGESKGMTVSLLGSINATVSIVSYCIPLCVAYRRQHSFLSPPVNKRPLLTL